MSRSKVRIVETVAAVYLHSVQLLPSHAVSECVCVCVCVCALGLGLESADVA